MPATATIAPPSRWARLRERFVHSANSRVALAIVIGALAGFFAVLYHYFIEILDSLALSAPIPRPYRALVFTALGGLLCGILLLKMRQARGSGLNQIRTALLVYDGYVSVRGTIAKFLASGIGIGFGLPLGPEDPAVHIGGGIASLLGRSFRLDKQNLQQLLPVGAAAGLAAAFNTPITAVMFTLEEIVGDINSPLLGSAIVGSVVAVMVRRAMLGNSPIFAVPEYTFDHLSDLVYYVVLGIVSGAASGAFTQLLLKLRAIFGRIPRGPRIDLVSTCGALLAGALGLFAPAMLGIGYSSVNEALNGRLVFSSLLTLAVLKLLGTAIAFSSGNSGGLFAPTLFIGAMFGGTVGSIFIHAGKHAPAHIGAFALVGMGAVFAGVTRSPITSIFMIFELTQDYAIMLPVMVAISISFAVARFLQRPALFELLAQQDGVYLPHKGEARESALQIANAMRPVSYLITPQQDVATALDKLHQANARAAVIAKEGRLAGVITESILVAAEGKGTVADHLVSGAGYTVYPDQAISVALRKLGAGAFILPVVSRVDPGLLMGTVTTADVLSAYGIERSYTEPQPTPRVRPELREAT